MGSEPSLVVCSLHGRKFTWDPFKHNFTNCTLKQLPPLNGGSKYHRWHLQSAWHIAGSQWISKPSLRCLYFPTPSPTWQFQINICHYVQAGMSWHSNTGPENCPVYGLSLPSFYPSQFLWWRRSNHNGCFPSDINQYLSSVFHGMLVPKTGCCPDPVKALTSEIEKL